MSGERLDVPDMRLPAPARLVGDLVGLALAAPLLAVHGLARRVIGTDASFRAVSETLALLPGPLGLVVRRAAYRHLLARCGSDIGIGFGTVLAYPGSELGEHVFIGRYCTVGLVTVGDDVMVADGVRLLSGRHGQDAGVPMREQATWAERIRVGRDVWIAAGAIVLADVGDGSVVGAGSVVTRPVPPGVLAAGVPATPLRDRPARG